MSMSSFKLSFTDLVVRLVNLPQIDEDYLHDDPEAGKEISTASICDISNGDPNDSIAVVHRSRLVALEI